MLAAPIQLAQTTRQLEISNTHTILQYPAEQRGGFVHLALRTSGVYPLGSEKSSMFTRKRLLRWLTTPYSHPDPLPNSGACIYPRRHRRLIAHTEPPTTYSSNENRSPKRHDPTQHYT